MRVTIGDLRTVLWETYQEKALRSLTTNKDLCDRLNDWLDQQKMDLQRHLSHLIGLEISTSPTTPYVVPLNAEREALRPLLRLEAVGYYVQCDSSMTARQMAAAYTASQIINDVQQFIEDRLAKAGFPLRLVCLERDTDDGWLDTPDDNVWLKASFSVPDGFETWDALIAFDRWVTGEVGAREPAQVLWDFLSENGPVPRMDTMEWVDEVVFAYSSGDPTLVSLSQEVWNDLKVPGYMIFSADVPLDQKTKALIECARLVLTKLPSEVRGDFADMIDDSEAVGSLLDPELFIDWVDVLERPSTRQERCAVNAIEGLLRNMIAVDRKSTFKYNLNVALKEAEQAGVSMTELADVVRRVIPTPSVA